MICERAVERVIPIGFLRGSNVIHPIPRQILTNSTLQHGDKHFDWPHHRVSGLSPISMPSKPYLLQARELASQGPAQLKAAVAMRLRALEASTVIAPTDFDAMSLRCALRCTLNPSRCPEWCVAVLECKRGS